MLVVALSVVSCLLLNINSNSAHPVLDVWVEYSFPKDVDPRGPDVYWYSWLGLDLSRFLYFQYTAFDITYIPDSWLANRTIGPYTIDSVTVQKYIVVEFYDADEAEGPEDYDDHYGDSYIKIWDLFAQFSNNPNLEIAMVAAPIVKYGAATGDSRYFARIRR